MADMAEAKAEGQITASKKKRSEFVKKLGGKPLSLGTETTKMISAKPIDIEQYVLSEKLKNKVHGL